MKINYFITGGALLLLLASFFLLRSPREEKDNVNNLLIPASSFSHGHGIAVDIADAERVYIATHEGLYLLRNDRDLFRIGNSRNDLMGFSAHPLETETFFSSGHPPFGGNLGFQKSSDGGLTWEKVSDGLDGPVDFHAMTVSPADPDVIYGYYNGKLQRSGDGGRSWDYAKGMIIAYSLSSHPFRSEILYAATPNGVHVSEDGGNMWRSLSAELEGGAVSVFALHPTDEQFALAFAEALGGLGKSFNGGKTWHAVSERFGGEVVLYLSYSRSKPDIVYALTNKNSVYKSGDRGSGWVKIR